MGKVFEKQIKIIEDQGKKQVDASKDLKVKEQTKAIENLIPNSALINDEAKKEPDKIKEMEN